MHTPISSQSTTGQERLPIWLGAVLVFTLWTLARPYVGIRHDGVLYMAQVLLQQHPQAMSNDLFFAYGSQDQYSVFSQLIAWLYAAWGMPATQVVVLMLCHAVFAAALACILWNLLPVSERWLGLAAVAVLSHTYGGLGIFAFAETFVTARTLAEPLALAALAALLRGRSLLAALLLLLAAAAHPLVALTGAVVGWLWLCQENRRWIWLAGLGLLPLALAFTGREPFAGLLRTFDDDWWAQVQEINRHVLLSNWLLVDWQIVTLDVALLLVAARRAAASVARLSNALVVAAALMLFVSAIAGDLLRDVLITGLQPWRVLWLVHLFALALLPSVFLSVWKERPHGSLCAMALAISVVAVNGRWEAGWVFLLWFAFMGWVLHRREELAKGFVRAAGWASMTVLAALSIAVGLRALTVLEGFSVVIDARTALALTASMPAVALPAANGILVLWRKTNRFWLLAALLALPAIYGVSNWDRRDLWTRLLESSVEKEHPFEQFIPQRAQVYWLGDARTAWALLKRPHYVSKQQGAGLLFNRNTALEFARRSNVMAPIEMQRDICGMMNALNDVVNDPNACAPDIALVEDLCRAQGGPDFLVADYRLPRGGVARWTDNSGHPQRTFYLYDCIQLR